ncbi:hypothetical protein D5F01_LYC09273 [Xyrichtys novacula]|uniref:Uncharacterized protein n=1 Tax=Xyrichtys novacula TaxID=13765 RepID=A0AAV1G9C0_XYRNO|nr:hypothetical protein D5F01_LYC09273 [Xyrichtys novacula]
MPTASGATGRVDVGVDGPKRNTKPNRNCDSYLQLYQEQKKRNKIHVLPNVQETTSPSVKDESEGEKTDQFNQIKC